MQRAGVPMLYRVSADTQRDRDTGRRLYEANREHLDVMLQPRPRPGHPWMVSIAEAERIGLLSGASQREQDQEQDQGYVSYHSPFHSYDIICIL